MLVSSVWSCVLNLWPRTSRRASSSPVSVSTYLHAGKPQRQFAGVVEETGHKRSDRLFVIISGLLFLQSEQLNTNDTKNIHRKEVVGSSPGNDNKGESKRGGDNLVSHLERNRY